MIRRIVFWTLGIVAVTIVVGAAAFAFTPWPSVALVQYMFSKGDQASEAALEKHVPANVETRRNLAYGQGRAEVFDINYPQGTRAQLPTIVWVHGGGWVAGSKDGVANYLKVLAGRGYTTVGLEYPHGFGVTYPEPVEKVGAALAYLVANAVELNIDAERIVLAGDSAGAQIASQIAIITTDPAYASLVELTPTLRPDQLKGVLLVSGAYDIESIDLGGQFGWLVETVLWAYSGTRNFLHDDKFLLASVLQQVTGAFPPAFVSSGNGDPLHGQAMALAEKLEKLGVKVASLFFPSDYQPPLPHEYQFNLDNEAGREALERMMSFVESVTG